ncbi:MAG: hypothetical protein JWO78_1168 [Micavibrio sp.]|nr:hypothetical protein [Micavibrio sp.]
MKRMILALCLMGAAVLAACAPTTQTTGASFTDPAYRGQRFASLVVEADKAGLQERQAIENGTAQALRKSGVNARTSLELLPPTREYSDSAVRQALGQTGAQGVIEIIPAAKQIRERYFPPTYHAGIAHGRYGTGFGGGMMFGPGFYDPGYTVDEPRVTYNVTLYAVPGYRKVWTGEFRTDGSGGMDYGDVGSHFGSALVQRLQQDGLIP